MADKNIEVLLKDVRLSFADIFEPRERKNDEDQVTGYYLSSNFLVKKDDPQLETLKKAMKDALEAGWPGQSMKIPPERRCVRDGEPPDADTGVRAPLYDGYDGCFYVSANKPLKSKTRIKEEAYAEVREENPVQILGARKGADGKFPVLKANSLGDKPYAGCYVDAIIRIYPYDGKKDGNPNRINASLEAIKFKRHGDAFGAKPVDAQSQFEDEPGDEFDGAAAGGGTPVVEDDMLG